MTSSQLYLLAGGILASVGCGNTIGDSVGSTRAQLSALPSHSSPYYFEYPTPPEIWWEVGVSSVGELDSALNSARSEGHTRIYFTSTVVAPTYDVNLEGMNDIRLEANGSELGSVILGDGTQRIELVGGVFNSVQFLEPSFTISGSPCDEPVLDVGIVDSKITNWRGGDAAIDIRYAHRVLIWSNNIESPRYSIYAGNRFGCESEYIGVFENDIFSYQMVGLQRESTVRLIDVSGSVIERNTLTNEAFTAAEIKHNYRVHGSSRFNHAFDNYLNNGGVAIGTCTASTCGADAVSDQHFHGNVTCNTAPELFKVHRTQTSYASVTNNLAYSDTWSSYVEIGGPGSGVPASWTISDNSVVSFDAVACPLPFRGSSYAP